MMCAKYSAASVSTDVTFTPVQDGKRLYGKISNICCLQQEEIHGPIVDETYFQNDRFCFWGKFAVLYSICLNLNITRVQMYIY